MLFCRRMTADDIPAAAAIEAAVYDSWSAETIALTLASPTSHCLVAVERWDAGDADGLRVTDGLCGAESLRSEQSAGNSDAFALAEAGTQLPCETVCGFCACTLVADTCNLDAVSVAPDYRRCGAGRALVTHAMTVLRGAGAACMWLEVRSENAPALALYASLGFVQNGLRRGFYENPPDDAVLMTAELNCRNSAN